MPECGEMPVWFSGGGRARDQEYAAFILTAQSLDVGMPMVGDSSGSNDLFFAVPGGEAAGGQAARGNYAIGNLAINLYGAPGGQDSITVTLRRNGVDTAVIVVVAGAALRAEFRGFARIRRGDLIYWRVQRTSAFQVAAGLLWEQVPI